MASINLNNHIFVNGKCGFCGVLKTPETVGKPCAEVIAFRAKPAPVATKPNIKKNPSTPNLKIKHCNGCGVPMYHETYDKLGGICSQCKSGKSVKWTPPVSKTTIYRNNDSQEKSKFGIGKIILACVILLFVLAPMCSRGNRGTDGVYESATKKIDRGRSDELTEEEKQRIHDILNYDK